MQTQARSDALIAEYIEQHPDRPGKDEARLKQYGISVWAIIGHWRGDGNAARVAADYEIPTEAVEAALAYYERHKAIIDNRLAANDPEEEERIAQELLHDPDERVRGYLEPNPHILGADEVRLKRYGVSVWAIIDKYKAWKGDVARVVWEYDVPVEAVEAAILYYERHKAIIDNRRAANYPEYVD